MKSLLLASAAFLFSSSLALAQTATSSPAPTGANNAPVETPSGASPGNTAPSSSMNAPKMMAPAQGSMSNSGGSMSSSAPAPTGAPNGAQMTQPGTSPGKTAPNTSTSSTNSTGMQTPMASSTPSTEGSMTPMHHHYSGMAVMSMPTNASASAYLHIANMAIRHHQSARADDALSRAETRLLTRSVPQSSGDLTDSSPAVASIEHARAALSSGNYSEASSDTSTAMQQAHSGMSGMTNASDTE